VLVEKARITTRTNKELTLVSLSVFSQVAAWISAFNISLTNNPRGLHHEVKVK